MSELRKLPMTDDEIAVSYRQAAHKASQIQILADLNNVGPAEMRRRLRALGFDIPDGRKKKPGEMDQAALMEAYRAGMTDYELMEKFSVAQASIQKWRAKEHLSPNVKADGVTPAVCGIFTVADLLSALAEIADKFPDAQIYLDDQKPLAVQLSALWSGAAPKVAVTLTAI